MVLTEGDLDGFTGTERYYKHPIGPLLLTDGVQYLATEGKAFWLIDAVGSYQSSVIESRMQPGRKIPLKSLGIQFWKLAVEKDKTATLTCIEDSGYDPVVTQTFKYTDFPLKEVKLYVQEGIVLLPSEY